MKKTLLFVLTVLMLCASFLGVASVSLAETAQTEEKLYVTSTDWNKWNWGTNEREHLITENGMVFKETIKANTAPDDGVTHLGGFAAYTLSKGVSTADGLSAEVSIEKYHTTSRLDVWFGSAGGQTSWTQAMNSFVFLIKPNESRIDFYVRTANGGKTNSYYMSYDKAANNGKIQLAVVKEGDAWTAKVNGVAYTEAMLEGATTVAPAVAIPELMDVIGGTVWFGASHAYTGKDHTEDVETQYTVSKINGKVLASADDPEYFENLVGAKVDGEFEFVGVSPFDNLHENKLGTNPSSVYIDERGFVIENTFKAGVPLADSNGVAGGWTGVFNSFGDDNNLDEYSIRADIPTPYYESENVYSNYSFWFADRSGVWNTALRVIFMRATFKNSETPDGGTLLIQTLSRSSENANDWSAELDTQMTFPAYEENGVPTNKFVASIRKDSVDGNYYMYINGTKLDLAGVNCNNGELKGQPADLAIKTQLSRMEAVFFGSSNELVGTPVADGNDLVVIEAVNGKKIVNKVPDLHLLNTFPAKPRGDKVTTNSIKLAWNQHPYAGVDAHNFKFDGYVIEVTKGRNTEVIQTVKLPLDTRSYVFEGLDPDTSYNFVVSAVSGYDTENPIYLVKYASVTGKTNAIPVEDPAPTKKGCGGSVMAVNGASVLLAAAVVAFVRRRKEGKN